MINEELRVSQHPLLSVLDSLPDVINRAVARAADEPDVVPVLARLAAQAEHVRTAFVGADPMLVSDQLLSQAHGHCGSVVAQLESYVSGSGRGYVEHVAAEMDSLLAAASRVPVSISGPRAAAVTRALSTYHDVVRQQTKGLQGRVSALQERLAQMTALSGATESRLQNVESRTDAVIGQLQSTFETVQGQRQAAFDNASQLRQATFDTHIATQRTRFDEAIEQLRAGGSAVLDQAKADRSAAQTELREAHNQLQDDAKRLLDEFATDVQRDADTLMASLRNYRDVAGRLVGLIGERGVTSTYQRTANEARREMWIWQVQTVVVLFALLGGAIFEFVPALKGGWNWGIGGARLMVTVVATLLAAYTGAQAKIARDTVRHNRRREMDLAALEPYMASLPEDQQHALRNKVADRYFVVDEQVPVPASSVEALLQDPEVVAAAKEMPRTALIAAIKQLAK